MSLTKEDLLAIKKRCELFSALPGASTTSTTSTTLDIDKVIEEAKRTLKSHAAAEQAKKAKKATAAAAPAIDVGADSDTGIDVVAEAAAAPATDDGAEAAAAPATDDGTEAAASDTAINVSAEAAASDIDNFDWEAFLFSDDDDTTAPIGDASIDFSDDTSIDFGGSPNSINVLNFIQRRTQDWPQQQQTDDDDNGYRKQLYRGSQSSQDEETDSLAHWNEKLNSFDPPCSIKREKGDNGAEKYFLVNADGNEFVTKSEPIEPGLYCLTQELALAYPVLFLVPSSFRGGQLPMLKQDCIGGIVIKTVEKKGFGVFAKKILYNKQEIHIPIHLMEKHADDSRNIADEQQSAKEMFIDHYAFSQVDSDNNETNLLYPDLSDYSRDYSIQSEYFGLTEHGDVIITPDTECYVKYMFNTTDEEFRVDNKPIKKKHGEKCVYGCEKEGEFFLSDGTILTGNICFECAKDYNEVPEYVRCITGVSNHIQYWVTKTSLEQVRYPAGKNPRLGIRAFVDAQLQQNKLIGERDTLKQMTPSQIVEKFGKQVDAKWLRKLSIPGKKKLFPIYNYGQTNVNFRFHYGSEGECMIFEVTNDIIEEGEELLISYNYGKRVKA
tara:strand:- start:16099 stop:17925 length:1827 start_codon:yes stop_codon:yes gene_type:complete